MAAYLARRVLYMIPTLIVISMVSFLIIQAPPGDYLTSMISRLQNSGNLIDQSVIDALRLRYGLDKPITVQYWYWISGFVTGNLGYSFEWNRPVSMLIGQRLMLTLVISLVTMVFTWLIGLCVGFYSAVKQYSSFDYIFTSLSFLGWATPNFLLALVLLYISYRYFGFSVGGLFSPQFADAPWSWERVVDLLQHLWAPIVVIGISGTAGVIRVVRANLLDELKQPYVITAIAKGVPRWRALIKYPLRIAINPLLSTVGWLLPGLISGEVIVSIVLGLPTTGPLFLRALLSQDMYLAGSFLMLLATLTVVGTLISDLLLAWVDPRVRFE